MHIRNPVEWGVDQLKFAGQAMEYFGRAARDRENRRAPPPAVRHISTGEILDVLHRGLDDFAAFRSDVIFLCVIYPVIGLVLVRLDFGYEMLPLLFPLASGFALIGPLAAVGLYQMSRLRQQGRPVSWLDAFSVFRSAAIGAIAMLGLILMVIFLAWLATAQSIYELTLGPAPPASLAAFAHDVLQTPQGWVMIGVGIGVGFLFALLVLAISVVSFPLLLDREVALETAVWTSLRAVAANPGPMAVWGLTVAALLVVGSIPAFLGLVIVLPVLGHATWHLYRKVVPR
jgi:uncharacterized membrane protein